MYLLKEDRKFRNHIGEIDRVYYITVKFYVIKHNKKSNYQLISWEKI